VERSETRDRAASRTAKRRRLDVPAGLIQIKATAPRASHTAAMIAAPVVEPELLRRYDRPGPRYTSYPTAPQFHDGFGETQLRQAIRESNADPIPRRLSLYVHVPFCTSPCFYCGCNRVITRDAARGERYLDHVEVEIGRTAPLFDRDRDVMQLHFGGGTPNFIGPDGLARIIESLDRHFHFSRSASRDFSIELDPRFVAPGDIAAMASLGLNRASLGVQDFDPEVQQAVNRVQSVVQTLDVIEACRAAGMRSINVDLIYGLPKQNLAGFARTLQTVIQARPDRIAVYGYAHMPLLFKAQRRIVDADLPDPETRLALLQLAIERLGEAGYDFIGMDHFALPQDELSQARARGDLHRNFMGYTTHADTDLVGFGVSAISRIGETFSQNPRDLASWEQALDRGHLPVWRGLRLDRDDVLRADVIQSLMCHGRLDTARLGARHDVDFDAYFAAALPRLRELESEGLVRLRPGLIEVTSRGRLLLRIIATCFDAYLPSAVAPPGDAPRFSRLI
jgi:oxygen-independent coproporphyrinogen-3 oxidase